MRALLVAVVLASFLLGGCPSAATPTDTPDPDVLYMFHNGSGPMCLDALDWLADLRVTHPALTVQEHLTYEAGEANRLARFAALYTASQGVSDSFAYLPIIFFRGQAFSGFSAEVAQALETLVVAGEAAP